MSSDGTSAQTIAIRRARVEDTESITALCTQLGYPSSPEQVRRRLAEILLDGDHVVLVAELRPGKVIGWVQMHVRKLVVVDRHAEIVGLVVDEGHRGKQVGRRLLAEAEAWARAQECGAIRLRSNVLRTDAHRFYENLGYGIIKTQRAFRKALPTDDCDGNSDV